MEYGECDNQVKMDNYKNALPNFIEIQMHLDGFELLLATHNVVNGAVVDRNVV